jgi:hypothetical protein
MSPSVCSYVLPIRMSEPWSTEAARELTDYLEMLAAWGVEVIVVDGSPPALFAQNARRWQPIARHVAPDPRHAALSGKVTGVLTGVDLADREAVVIADDDVRYTHAQLIRVTELLRDHDLVRPQNYFSPMPWHAVWDTARTLINRAFGPDFPGTLAVRHSMLRITGGYDGDVLFENLELIRTVEAHGGSAASPLDLYVRRLPPATGHFFGQRTRQAYDDFALPERMAVWLSIVPLLCASVLRQRPAGPAAFALAAVVAAESGRRRAGGTEVFPAMASVLAPAWLLERGVCAWLAVLARLRFGGVRYGDRVFARAAHSRRQLRQLAVTRHAQCVPAAPSATPPRARPLGNTAGS